jgi:formylglycine-generating enzyme required for sulfatase activity
MFGVQWDLVLKHLSNKGVTDSLLKEDSSTWGNYYNQPFEINRGKYSQASPWNTFIDYTTATANKVTYENGVSTKLANKSILLTTGASDTNSKYNIYDLAGNVYEWTLERTSNTSHPCAYRGGNFDFPGSYYPASYRFYDYPTFSYFSIGFRCSLY